MLGADDVELSLLAALTRVFGRERDALVFPLGSKVAFAENHEGQLSLLRRS